MDTAEVDRNHQREMPIVFSHCNVREFSRSPLCIWSPFYQCPGYHPRDTRVSALHCHLPVMCRLMVVVGLCGVDPAVWIV